MTDSPGQTTDDDVAVPAPSGRPTYTDAELRAAFDKVKNRNNWKYPSTHHRPHPTKPGKWLISAIGYYAAVGS